MDPKTVRRYIRTAEATGLDIGLGPPGLTDERLGSVLIEVRGDGGRPKGESWSLAAEQRGMIRRLLDQSVRLSKIRRLLARQGVRIPYATLHRFAVAELDLGRTAATIPIADGEPGHEIQLDTGWMTLLRPDLTGRWRRFRAWIFCPVVSRLRFVYPCFQEATASAIEACEAAWDFYGGVFRVILPDNTKVIVHTADSLEPKLNAVFVDSPNPAYPLDAEPFRPGAPG